jgi:hypothetical protein
MSIANRGKVRCAMVACALALATATSWAGGPRFVSGTSGYTNAGLPMAWYTAQPMYFTDPGELSTTVSHAQSNAMVAAAAAVWNIPTANITLTLGGELAEHVSSTNTTVSGTDVVFPADVEPTNYQAIQIPIIYDTNGSITNLLLGAGASDTNGCLQNGVTESVDSFGSNGTIQHAVIVLNGLCVGSNAEQLEQMQYQLTRVFGRILGLAWSQLNDNVFTGVSTVTAAQMALWPLMHPIDIICGTYTYQCVQNPFTLRPDDIAALSSLYPVTSTTSTKTRSSFDTISASGVVNFPTGQGMELANVTVTRMLIGVDGGYEPYSILSSTTGYPFQQNGGNPVNGPESASQNAGSDQSSDEGAWNLAYIPSGTGTANLMISTEAINPLYYDEYAVGAYQRPVISMSGPAATIYETEIATGTSFTSSITQTGASSICSTGDDGMEASPAASNATGWWSGLLCSTGHTSWWSTTVNANTSWTIEITALNETGAATEQKAQTVIGVWNSTDPTGTQPTVASQAAALNSILLGMTQLQMPSTTSASTLRIAVADQFGAGRPDFAYTARILYASSVSPATLSPAGGQIVISGTGFQTGCVVTINGVTATVLSLTSTQIVATAPSMAAAGASSGAGVDVIVRDPSTNGTTDMQATVTYSQGTIDVVALVSAPTALETGFVAATPFAVRVYASNGVTPVAGASVSFVVVGSGGGAAVATGCGSGTGCVVKTDATGLASTPLMGVAAGSVTVSGTEMSGGASVQATIMDVNPARMVAINAVSQYLAAGASESWSLSLTATQDGAVAADIPVTWSTPAAGFTLMPATGVTAANGTEAVVAQVNAIASASTNIVTGCAWTTVCASWTVYGVAPSQWVITVSSGGEQSVVLGGKALVPVELLVTDGAGHALPGATVNLYQTSYAWEGACPAAGACAAPVLATSQSSAISNSNGLVQVEPQLVQGVAQVLKIAASTGTRGFTTTSLTVTP